MGRTFWVLWTAQLINRLGGFIFTFLALYLTQDRHLSTETAGAIVSLHALGQLFGTQLGGRFADRVGRRPALLTGTFLGALTVLLLGLVSNLYAIAFFAFAFGLCGDLYRPAIFAVVSDVVPAEQRKRAYNYQYWAVNLGFAVAAASAGWLATHGYFWLFAGDAATTLFAFVIIWLAVPETKPKTIETTRSSAWVAWKNPTFATFALIHWLAVLAFVQVQVALPLDMVAKGMTPATYGSVIAINGVIIVLLQPIVGRLTERMNNGIQIGIGCLFLALGVGAQAFARMPWHYAVTISVWTIGEILFSSATPAIVAKFAPADERATYQSGLITVWVAGSLVAPLVGPAVLTHFGPIALWLGAAVLAWLATIGHFSFTRVVTARD